MVVLCIDEMTVQSNLVYDSHTHELIGFTDLGDPDLNFNCLNKSEELATHALVFLVRGLSKNLTFPLAYFATSSLTSSQLFPLFWKAVFVLEMFCGLKVIATTWDKASANQRCRRMMKGLDTQENEKPVTYRVINLYASDRYIYFISDQPHLMKTIRN